MKKIKNAFLILTILTFIYQGMAFGECDKVKKACSISDLKNTPQITDTRIPAPESEKPEIKPNKKFSIKSWLKSLK